MADDETETEAERPYDYKQFAAKARQLIEAHPQGKTRFLSEMKKLGGPASQSFVDRLWRGDVNMERAVLVKQAIAKMGGDIGQLPSLDPHPFKALTEEAEWMSRWLEMGRLLYQHLRGSRAFDECLATVERLATAVQERDELEARRDQGLTDALHPTKT